MKHLITHILLIAMLLTGYIMPSSAMFTKYRTPDYYEANTREHFRHNRWRQARNCWTRDGSCMETCQ